MGAIESSPAAVGQLADLVAAVRRSPKYRQIAPALVQRIGGQELARRRTLKAAIKATKSRLHQVGGAYFNGPLDYDGALARVRDAAGVAGPAAWQQQPFREACREIMRYHASTRERLPILDEFYARTLADLPLLRVVVDLACGLNPLARPWMPLAEDTTYLAYDVYADVIDFLGQFMTAAAMPGRAEVRDIVGDPPSAEADLVLLLKSLPCLEMLEKGAASALLDALRARYLLISFPVRSLTGRLKGMATNYDAFFQTLASGRGWRVTRFAFESELAYLVQT